MGASGMRATADGTAHYAASHPAAAGHFRQWRGLTVSSVGLGSYLGDVSTTASAGYAEATRTALQGGCNVLDTASNYREQESERDLGLGIRRYLEAGGARADFLVATKAGFLHGDGAVPMQEYVQKRYVDTGLVEISDLAGGIHCMTPAYLETELERSLENLGLAAVDVFFIHNPETQLQSGVPAADFYARLQAAFESLERLVDAGRIGYYGLATWDGLRVPPGTPGHLDLAECLSRAAAARAKVGPGDHHLAAIQLPVNVAMTEAHLQPTQRGRLGPQTLLELTLQHDLLVLASASLVQTNVFGRIPPEWSQVLGTSNDAETCIQFTRSVQGVTTALVGMGNPEHARTNLAYATKHPPDPKTVGLMLGPGGPHG